MSTVVAIAPACRHFGDCGGCTAQLMAPDEYRAWKRALVTEALARNRLDTDVAAELASVAPATRRVARFGARDGVVGFTERGGRRLVEIPGCQVLRPEIVEALPALHALVPTGVADLPVTLCESGLDVVLRSAREPDMVERQRLAALASKFRFARISWQRAGSSPRGGAHDRRHVAGLPEPVASLRPVRVTLSGVVVELPPSAFVQPTAEGEAVLVREVLAALAGARRVADLYAGCGPFALALARSGARVHACEGDGAMAEALAAAARRAQLLVTVEQRDLAKRPLFADELALDGLVLDPPRAGAARQAAEIARSSIPTVVYASCSPESFARDARVLVDGGYRLARVVPLDQFLWSPHVELVATFRR